MNPKLNKLVAILSMALFWAATPASAAVLDGQTVAAEAWCWFPHGQRAVLDYAASTVGPIVELIDFRGFMDIDFSDTNILITASADEPNDYYTQFLLFEDVNGTIPRFTSVTVNPATNWANFNSNAIQFDANSIDLYLWGLNGLEGQQISLDLTATVPEPGTLTLCTLFGVAAAVWGIRRGRARSRPVVTRVFASLVFVGAAWLVAPQPTSAVTISWIPVGNPSGGSVPYAYRIGTYDVTVSQYVEFLNAKDPVGANTLALYNNDMGDATYGGISFSDGAAEGVKYGVISGRGNHPVNYVTWYDAIRFANWLNNGQGTGDTETGAYTLGVLGAGGVPVDGLGIRRNAGASVFLPSSGEWTKAAYYDSVRNTYFQFPTSRNAYPTASAPTSTRNSVNAENAVGNVTDVGAYTATTSPYGAFDMGGNVYQWTDELWSGPPPPGPRIVAGQGFDGFVSNMIIGHGAANDPTVGAKTFGFRVAAASIPEPATVGLAAFGVAIAAGLAVCGRRRGTQDVARR